MDWWYHLDVNDEFYLSMPVMLYLVQLKNGHEPGQATRNQSQSFKVHMV